MQQWKCKLAAFSGLQSRVGPPSPPELSLCWLTGRRAVCSLMADEEVNQEEGTQVGADLGLLPSAHCSHPHGFLHEYSHYLLPAYAFLKLLMCMYEVGHRCVDTGCDCVCVHIVDLGHLSQVYISKAELLHNLFIIIIKCP